MSEQHHERIVRLSKKKIILLLCLSIGFVALGCWMLFLDDATIQAQRRYNNPIFVHGLGLVSILFFGLCGAAGLRKLGDPRPGLVFNSRGIFLNANGFSTMNIDWAEIQGFSEYEIRGQKMLVVLLKNPERFIDGSPMKKAVQRANLKMCGSPITISANSLEIGHAEMLALAEEFFTRYGSRNN